mmetsp:Transcript_48427/g.113384  ORF Transcript_48427/g.113384 Transcript_48427/m.113384 type:complete len:246 (-) Transcript_48427:536-1273(-)
MMQDREPLAQQLSQQGFVFPDAVLGLGREKVGLLWSQADHVVLVLTGDRVDGEVGKGSLVLLGNLLPRLRRQLCLKVSALIQVNEHELQLVAPLDAPPGVGENTELLVDDHRLPPQLQILELPAEGQTLRPLEDLVVGVEEPNGAGVVPEGAENLVHNSPLLWVESLRCGPVPVVAKVQGCPGIGDPDDLSSSSLKQRQEPSVVQRSSVPELVRNRRLPLGENVRSDGPIVPANVQHVSQNPHLV